jgi:sec-independent protein translocase protein TatA
LLNAGRNLENHFESEVATGGFVIEGLFQPMHLILIFGVALLVFGPKKLPELGKGLGDGIRGFKAAMNSTEEKKDGPVA